MDSTEAGLIRPDLLWSHYRLTQEGYTPNTPNGRAKPQKGEFLRSRPARPRSASSLSVDTLQHPLQRHTRRLHTIFLPDLLADL